MESNKVLKIKDDSADFDWDIMPKVEGILKRAVADLYGEKTLENIPVIVTETADKRWGDYTSNISMRLASLLNQSPQEIANNIKYRLDELIKEDKTGDDNCLIFEKISVAGSGYINFYISDKWLKNLLVFLSSCTELYRVDYLQPKVSFLSKKKIMVEYTDPNPFKTFHIGHLMPNTVGECISRIFEFLGADVKRASYQGDVGMHVAKAIFGMLIEAGKRGLTVEGLLKELEKNSIAEKMSFLGKSYSFGALAYDNKDDKNKNEDVRNVIRKINILVYISAQKLLQESKGWKPLVDYKSLLDNSSLGGVKIPGIDYKSEKDSISEVEKIFKLYTAGRAWSLNYFETIYEVLGTKFDYYYFESMTAEVGYQLVTAFLKDTTNPPTLSYVAMNNPILHPYIMNNDARDTQKVFENDNGVVVFRGERYGLHTRVFLNSKGLPTYEAKDLGLFFVKKSDFDYDSSYIITASEQAEYFKVVFKALELIDPALASRNTHISNGMMILSDGKMSSRTGKVISVNDLLGQLSHLILGKMSSSEGSSDLVISQKIAVSALKYAILRQQLGKDVVYDKEKSIQLIGDTGPYLEYSFVRALSLLQKSNRDCFSPEFLPPSQEFIGTLNEIQLLQEESELLRHMLHFQEIVLKSAQTLSPSYICSYLHDLASKFNTFYANVPVLSCNDGEPETKQHLRLMITKSFCLIMNTGLHILGIETVSRM